MNNEFKLLGWAFDFEKLTVINHAIGPLHNIVIRHNSVKIMLSDSYCEDFFYDDKYQRALNDAYLSWAMEQHLLG